MLPVIQYKEILLNEFYLDEDDMTIRRKKDGYHGKFKKHDKVIPYRQNKQYHGVHVPRTRATVPYHWLLTLLRNVAFDNNSVIDHLDGNSLNNNRDNIRVTTQRINTKNARMRCDNKTGYTGICWNIKAKMYYVRKTINNKRLYRSSKTLDGAIAHLKELVAMSLSDGYTARHGSKV